MSSKLLSRSFFEKNTIKTAKNLIGCYLVRKLNGKVIKGMIVETEAYRGENDLACHAAKGRTKRTEVMYGPAGCAYVYLIYGMHHCLNIVTEQKDFPAAVLIRSIRIENIPESKTDGPGKLCRFLKIDRRLNGYDVIRGEKLWIEPRDTAVKLPKIKKSPRIGIDYARHCRNYLWRFHF